MIENRQVLINLHTANVTIPDGSLLELGEIAVQHNDVEPVLYIKKNDGSIAKFIDVAAIDAKLSKYATSADTESAIKVVVDAISAETSRAEGIEDAMSGRIDALEALSGESHTHSNKALLDTYTQTEANLADAVAKKHEHTNKDVLDGVSADKVTAWDDAVAKKHEHTNKDILDGVSAEKVAAWDAAEQNAKDYAKGLDEAMDLRVDALEAISGQSHTHANKDVLDGVSAEKVAAWDDAVAKKHEHANATELNKIVDGDKAKWDDAVSRLDNFLVGTGTADVVDTLQDIKNWMDGDGVVATELTEAIAGEAKLRGEADSAMSGRIDALEAISGQSHTHDNKALLDTYAQTEVDLADAVAKKHEHTNKDVLDGVSAEKVAAWDAAEQNAKDYADGLAKNYDVAGAAASAETAAKAYADEAAAGVKTWVGEQNYLTSHQDISGLATKTEVSEAETRAITSANTYTDTAISKLRIDCGTF